MLNIRVLRKFSLHHHGINRLAEIAKTNRIRKPSSRSRMTRIRRPGAGPLDSTALRLYSASRVTSLINNSSFATNTANFFNDLKSKLPKADDLFTQPFLKTILDFKRQYV